MMSSQEPHNASTQDKNMKPTIHLLDIPGYEEVVEVIDQASGLHGFIAIHNTSLGPALGGVRIYPYRSKEEALNDALRLAKAMTKKSALAEVGLGGGKSVIIADPRKEKTEALLHAYGHALDTLQGRYIAAEDIGTSPSDMSIIREVTPYVAALPTETSSGDPSRFTAWGVYRAIEACCQKLFGSTSVKDRRIAIQGLGHVGHKIAEHLFWRGAHLIIADIDEAKCKRIAKLYQADLCPLDEIFTTPCDIFCPSAMGGILNCESIPTLQCRAIAGAANNQLLTEEDGKRLMEKNILYAPDFITNSGGIINASGEFEMGGYNPKESLKRVDKIFSILRTIFTKAEEKHISTSQMAEELAAENLERGIGKRVRPIIFSNSKH